MFAGCEKSKPWSVATISRARLVANKSAPILIGTLLGEWR